MAKQHLTNCTAEYFTSTWRKYDADGNGYIEEGELQSFLQDLCKNDGDIESFKKTFMSKYDKNKDGKIDMKELAELLKPEENFLFLIRTEAAPDSVEFKKIWKKYDTDCSGYIEAGELKNFLKDAYESSGKPLSPAKVEEYTTAVLNLYDRDDNHKLDFNEMIKLLPLASNFLTSHQFDKLTDVHFKTIFAHYDKDGNNSIEGTELDKLLGDILRKDDKEVTAASIATLRETVLKHCDKNQDGKIQYNELALVLSFK